MGVKRWTGSGWTTGHMGMSPGGTGAPSQGTVRKWPWVGGQNLVPALTYPAFAADGFGSDEAPTGTLFAANQLYTSTALGSVLPRVTSFVDLRLLSDNTTLVVSQPASATPTGGSLTLVSGLSKTQWNTVTVASPLQGGTAQAASFWDSADYPAKSIAPTYAGGHVFMCRVSTTGIRDALKTWVTNNPGSDGSLIGVSATYSDCTNMLAGDLTYVMPFMDNVPGAGGWPSAATMASDGMYGVFVPIGNLSGPAIATIKAAGLKCWGYNINDNATYVSFTNQGLDGALTQAPSTTAIPPVTPPDPTITFGYGANSVSALSTRMTETASLTTALDNPGMVRAYDQGTNILFSGTWGTSVRQLTETGRNMWLSWKPPTSSIATTANWVPGSETALRNAMDVAGGPGSGQVVFVTVYHEPEDVFGAAWSAGAAAGRTAWRAAQKALKHMGDRMRADGYEVYCAPVLCDWVWWGYTYGNQDGTAEQWYTSDAADWCDVMGWDIYPQGQLNTSNQQGPFKIGHLNADTVNYPTVTERSMGSGGSRPSTPAQPADYKIVPYNTVTGPRFTRTGAHAIDLVNDARYVKPGGDTYKSILMCEWLAKERGLPWANAECGVWRGREGGGVNLPAGTYADEAYYYWSTVQRAAYFDQVTSQLFELEHPPCVWLWYDDLKSYVTREVPDYDSIRAYNRTLALNPPTISITPPP